MKTLLTFIFVFYIGTIKAQTTDSLIVKSDTIIITVSELFQKSRVLYDEADKTLGQIDSVFVKKYLLIVSWDSAGIRNRVIINTDTFPFDMLK